MTRRSLESAMKFRRTQRSTEKKQKQFTVKYRATCVYEVTIDAASEDEARDLWFKGDYRSTVEIGCLDFAIVSVVEEK